jgi:hypothetical protein
VRWLPRPLRLIDEPMTIFEVGCLNLEKVSETHHLETLGSHRDSWFQTIESATEPWLIDDFYNAFVGLDPQENPVLQGF